MSAQGGLHSTERLHRVNLPHSSKPTMNPGMLTQSLGLITCPNLDKFSWETQKDYQKFMTQCMKAQKKKKLIKENMGKSNAIFMLILFFS